MHGRPGKSLPNALRTPLLAHSTQQFLSGKSRTIHLLTSQPVLLPMCSLNAKAHMCARLSFAKPCSTGRQCLTAVSARHRQGSGGLLTAGHVQTAQRHRRAHDTACVLPGALSWSPAGPWHAAEPTQCCGGPCAAACTWVMCLGHVCVPWR